MTTYKRKTNLAVRPVMFEMADAGRNSDSIEGLGASLGAGVYRPLEAPEFQDFITGLQDGPKEIVETRSKLFLEARAQAGIGYLEMGRHLSALRQVLEPMEMWKRYVNLFPNFTQATAYRMIWAWENAQRVLPPAMPKVAALEGYKIVDWRKGKGLAQQFKSAYRRVERKMGPAPAEDEGKAREFLQAVLVEKRRQVPQRERESERETWTKDDAQELRDELLRMFLRMVGRVPEPQRARFARESLRYLGDVIADPAASTPMLTRKRTASASSASVSTRSAAA